MIPLRLIPLPLVPGLVRPGRSPRPICDTFAPALTRMRPVGVQAGALEPTR